jgi:hypothetical protein
MADEGTAAALTKDPSMANPVRNPAALRLLIGWAGVAVLTLGGLAAAGFLPPSPAFDKVFVPALIAVMLQGGTALMAAKRGHERLGWIILLAPPVLFVVTVTLLLALAGGIG